MGYSKWIYILADEVYRYLQYESFSTSLQYLVEYSKYIFIDSFSKKFAIAGWRLGYLASHPDTLVKILKASQLTITHVAPFVRMAGMAALEITESINYAESMKTAYNERLKELCSYCRELKLEYVEAKGAFYLFVKLNRDIVDVIFRDSLLTNANTCIVPGSAFGG